MKMNLPLLDNYREMIILKKVVAHFCIGILTGEMTTDPCKGLKSKKKKIT